MNLCREKDMTTERITRTRTNTTTDVQSWWDSYCQNIAGADFSRSALSVLSDDTEYIVSKGIFAEGNPQVSLWESGHIRRGIVMGAVQSGKTASMLGVAAKAIDEGVNIVVILAGSTRTLWQQTLDRVVAQLTIQFSEGELVESKRVLLPKSPDVIGSGGDLRPSDYYSIQTAMVKRAVRQNLPIIAVVMKNSHHIRAFGEIIRDKIVPAFDEINRTCHMLVLDDEADDASVLDSQAEANLDPILGDLKQVPRAIADLWERRPHIGITISNNLFVTYIGYTATPAANFLQSNFNPLAPKDFAISLRTPFDVGTLTPRESTYVENKGLSNYYIGGEVFYRRLQSPGPAIVTGVDFDKNLKDAFMSYVVAAAIQIWRSGKSYSELYSKKYDTQAEIQSILPNPISMLVHVSALTKTHFDTAAKLMSVVTDLDLEICVREIDSGNRYIPLEEVRRKFSNERIEWQEVFESYRSSGEAVRRAFGLPATPKLPMAAEWSIIANLIEETVFPNLHLSIINSDPLADERPSFHPYLDEESKWCAPRDLLTIFVSGNVMSRGLTIEGLVTTLFLRTANEPLADTQMQMQRWFGYRGKYLDLCRVFLDAEQLALFIKYHDKDEALRRSIISAMNENSLRAPSVEVLQGDDFQATGKIAALRNWPLSPGPSPFIQITNSSMEFDPNLGIVAKFFKESPSVDVLANSTLRGRISPEPLTMVEAANLLDKLRFSDYVPTSNNRHADRWKLLETYVGIDEASSDSSLLPFFRPPGNSLDESDIRRNCPYSIAAYLRLWSACLTRQARGFDENGSSNMPWSMVDLRVKISQQPKFYVGIRYGSGSKVTDERFEDLNFDVIGSKKAVLGNEFSGTWGTQNPGALPGAYLGDKFFDFHFHNGEGYSPFVAGSDWRPPGSPGLILFYVNESSNDETPKYQLATGLIIPSGGPDLITAVSEGSR
jgi:hypothetical protein